MSNVVQINIPYAKNNIVQVVIAYDDDGFSGIYCWNENDKEYIKMNPTGFNFNNVLHLADYIDQSKKAFAKLGHRVNFIISDIKKLKHFNMG